MMNNVTSHLSLDTRATYRITIGGLLDATWSAELGNMHIEHTRRAGERPTTTLTGEVIDQAALAGILNLVYSLGYPLVSVDYIGREDHCNDSG